MPESRARRLATTALSRELREDQVVPIEPLYLRRPDAGSTEPTEARARPAPVPIRREVGCGPMIADITAVSRDLAVRSIAQLEGELFGRGAWNANMVRERNWTHRPAHICWICWRGGTGCCPEATPASGTIRRGRRAHDHRRGERHTSGKASPLRCFRYWSTRRNVKAPSRMLLEVRVDNDPALAPVSAVRIRTHGIAQTLLPARKASTHTP